MKHFDIAIGVAGVVAGFGLGAVNALLGVCVTGTMLFVWLIRARKEWKHRDDPPKKEGK